MALRLSIPAGLDNPNPPAEIRPKQLQEWLDSLPLTQLFDSARAVCDELARLNRTRLPAEERLKLLEVYQPVLNRLGAEIAEDYNKAALPLPATSRQAVNLARELLIEEAYAYKLALLERTGKLKLFGARKQLAPLIEQVMRTLSNVLTLSYQSYLPMPAGVWHEMHELYRYASQQKLLEEEDTSGASAVDVIYKQAVLLALTDPYRLPRAELSGVRRIANQLASLVELRFGPLPGAQQLFIIHPDTDKPPKAALQPGPDNEPRGNEWVVGTVLLVHRLSAVVAELESGAERLSITDTLYEPPKDLLDRLIQCWGAPPKRLFRRQAGQASVQACIGINRICRLLTGTTQQGGAPRAGPAVNIAVADESLQDWEVINQSAGGFKLRGEPTAESGVNVGEVIAVQYRGMLGVSVGAIRWAQTFEDNSVEFGVQMLAPRAESVSLEPTFGGRGAQRALLLPEIPALQQEAALIAMPGNFQQDREFMLAQTRDVSTIRAAELVEKTAFYELFRYVPG
jgi:hypothetical protein